MGVWLLSLHLIVLYRELSATESLSSKLVSTVLTVDGWIVIICALVPIFFGIGFLGNVERQTTETKYIDSFYCSLIVVGKAKCDDILKIKSSAANPIAKRAPSTKRQETEIGEDDKYFGGYRCSEDCSGHKAGYRWAMDKDLGLEDDCPENQSSSFKEGCMVYLEEQENLYYEEENNREKDYLRDRYDYLN